MDTLEPGPDDWSHWRQALAAKRGVDTEVGNPRSGYYRVKDEAWAFWRHNGELCCWRSGTEYPAPTKPDDIDQSFGWCAPHPISFEDFTHFQESGRWPDQISPVEVDANLSPHEKADAELTAQRAAMVKWVEEIKAISTQEQATKAGNFAAVFAKIETASEEARKAEKRPHDKAADAVQAKWAPVVKRAAELKTWAKKSTEPFLIAERARIAAEERAAADARAKAEREAAEARRQAEAAGAPPPQTAPAAFAPVPQKAKAGKVHLRSVTKHEIVSMRAVLEYLATLNDYSQDLKDVVQIAVNRMSNAGVKVPGVETKTVETAS